ncbi:MAG: Type 1 glutamine amidotransferase-like domain-containing protein [Clostridia bacterium]|nr:Type 1 glutamine amidotransferase-like domain-containing protein [Clostridia bacterium]
MKKLFLTSSFAGVADQFPAFAGADLAGKTVTFIPTAAIPEESDDYVWADRDALTALGLKIDILELTAATPEAISEKLAQNDFIYASGGNTFFLLQAVRASGADRQILAQIARGKIYIGASAGSMLMAPTIEYAKIMDSPAAAPGLQSFDALAAVAFGPLPHFRDAPYERETVQTLEQYGDQMKLIPITNAQAIAVRGDRVEILPV